MYYIPARAYRNVQCGGLSDQPGSARGQPGKDVPGPFGRFYGRDRRVAHLRVPVQVVEQFGDTFPGEPRGVLTDLLVAAGQQAPAAVGTLRLGPGQHHAPADDAYRVRVPARGGGRLPDHADRLADLGQVGAAGGDPALRDPPGALHGRPGHAAEQHRWPRLLNGPGILPPRRDGVELAVERADLVR